MSNDTKAIERLFKLLAKINMMVVDGSRDAESVSDALQRILEEKKSYLTNSTAITLVAIENPKRLKDCHGVWLSSNATKLFDSIDELAPVEERVIEHRDLIERLNDFDLVEKLGGNDAAAFASVAELEATISQMVIKQAGGKPGNLLNDGRSNIFYVRDPENHERVLFVVVSWHCGIQEWDIRCNPASAVQWVVGYCVFKATAA